MSRMVSREDAVIVGFGTLAVLFFVLLDAVASSPTRVSIAVVVVVGVLCPLLVNEYLDRHGGP